MTTFRHVSMVLAAATLIVASFGCDKKPQQPRQEPPAETGAEQPEADTGTSGEADAEQVDETGEADTGQPDQADADDASEQAAECPKPRDYQGMCAQVITWAQDPDTGQCCQYGSPCEAPENWATFSSEADCAQAGGQTNKTGGQTNKTGGQTAN